MPTPSKDKGSEYNRVWHIADYGNLDALMALRDRSAGGGAGSAGGTGGATLFPEGMPSGTSTITKNGQIKPTPAVQQSASAILKDPNAFVANRVAPEAKAQEQSLLDRGKSLLGQLFDVEDTWKDGKYLGAETPVESVWDSFLTGINWMYDRINQVTVAGLSGLPGGIRTLTWDEAGQVSVGQVGLANAAIAMDQANQGNVIGSLLSSTGAGPLGMLGSAISPDMTKKIASPNFDITNPQDRKIFEEDPVAKWSSGLTDAVFTVAADPFIVGGKALKITRLKYVDRPLTPKNVQKISEEITQGAQYAKTGDVEKMAPAARLVYDAVTPAADGTRIPTRQLYLRDEIKTSADGEGIADALSTVRDNDYAAGMLVVQSALGDTNALRQLMDMSTQAADALIEAKRVKLEAEIMQSPRKYAEVKTKYKAIADSSIKVLEDLRARRAAGENIAIQEISNAERQMYAALDDLNAIESGRLKAPIEHPSQEQMAMMAAIVEDAADRHEWFRKALSPSIYGSLQGADRGLATNTKIGRYVSARRAKRARADYERKSVSGQRAFSQDFFGNGRFKRIIRVWHVANDETPSYYVNHAANVDQGREVGAFLDSLEYLSGNPIEWFDPAAKITRKIGGISRKDELFQMYTSARSLGEEASLAMMKMQDEIRRDMVRYYGLDEKIMEEIHKRGISAYDQLKNEVRQSKNGYFLSDNADLNVAPFLETQFANGDYFLPWDTIERVAKNIKAKKVTNPEASALFTPSQEFGKKMLVANDVFQDFWRPLVLLRLGYPQRNVTEGLFRSMAYSSSIEPLVWAGKAGVASVKNYRRVQRAAKQAAKIKRQIDAPDAARDAFDGLIARQKQLHDREATLMGAQQRLADEEIALAEMRKRPEKVGWRPSISTSPDDIVEDAAGNPTVLVSDEGNFLLRKETSEVPLEGGAGVETVERWVLSQADPDDPSIFIPMKGSWPTLDEAQQAIDNAVVAAFDGTKVAPGPQFKIIRDKGAKARAAKVQDFMDEDGVLYSSSPEDIASLQGQIDAARAELVTVGQEIKQYGGRPIPEQFKTSKFNKWREKQIAAVSAQVEDDLRYEEFYRTWAGQVGQLDDPVIDMNLVVLRQMREQRESQLKWLEDDDYYALEAFTNQAQARRVAHNGTKGAATNGIVLNSAFGDPRYRDIHWTNMSSDNTIKATLAARMQLNDSIIYRMKIDDYVDVAPGAGDTYWEGMSTMLRQYSQSALGKQILRGDDPDKIAAWLISDPKGIEIRDNLDLAWRAAGMENNGIPRIGNDVIAASQFVSQVRGSLNLITAGNKDVWRLMIDHPPTPSELKSLMQNMPNLSPVVGSKSVVEGYAKPLEIWRKMMQTTFQKVGTQVEDAFVRGPFYAQRFEEVRDSLLDTIRSQFANQQDIPIDLILRAEVNAHRMALKQTKDFLYTIDRRTKLGKYGEIVFPFITASQNSLTTVGRLIRRDPSIIGVMAAMWQMPTKVGWEDKNGQIIIPLPHDLIPDGVEDAFGIRGMRNMTINKSSLNVIFPESGFAFVPRPAPLVQVAASELMKNGLFGQFGVEAPPAMVSILGAKTADQYWKYFKNYLYGEEGGISAEPLSFDKVLPPVVNRVVQYMQKDGSSQYAYQYALQARTEDLRWRAGERDDYPTSKEIMDRTNGIFVLRMLGNLLAFTPPNYESPVQPLIDMQRLYDEVYGVEGPMKFSENFGNEMLILSNTETTTNPAGVTSTPATIRRIKKYDGLIRSIVPGIGTDYDVVGMLVNGDAKDSFYDPNAYRWMQSQTIPGTKELWRDTRSGPESMAEAQRQAGWVEYIKFKGQLDGLLQQRGLDSYRSKGAEDLNAWRKEFIQNMRDNPMYEGWRVDWDSQGSSKTQSAIRTISAALRDPTFMADHAETKTWQLAQLYLEKRDLLIRLIQRSGVTLENDANAQLKSEWDAFRQDLINKDVGWANIANRYLGNDDNPVEPGASFAIGA